MVVVKSYMEVSNETSDTVYAKLSVGSICFRILDGKMVAVAMLQEIIPFSLSILEWLGCPLMLSVLFL